MELIINGHVIDSDLNTILTAIRNKTSGRYLGRMRSAGENIAISCPFHKDGQEKHPSCFVYSNRDNDSVPFATYTYEPTLLDRVVTYFGAGSKWYSDDKKVEIYKLNSDIEIYFNKKIDIDDIELDESKKYDELEEVELNSFKDRLNGNKFYDLYLKKLLGKYFE